MSFSPIFRARIGRQTLGRELATVHDYRQRLAQHRTDPGLRAAHEKGPWVTVWVWADVVIPDAITDIYTGRRTIMK